MIVKYLIRQNYSLIWTCVQRFNSDNKGDSSHNIMQSMSIFDYFNYIHARKCKQRDRELSSMNAEIPRKEKQKASGSRKTKYFISILYDTGYFPYFFM